MSEPNLIVGAGFSGAVLARELAEAGQRSLVIDQRAHLGGNCHTERDATTGIMEHRYGPHIFNTSNKVVWDYVNQFGKFHNYVNRVKASAEKGIFSLPINLHTINQFFGLRLSPTEAKKYLASKADTSIKEPQNFEEQALKFIGKELYEAFFRGYTLKQWGCPPSDLPASILKRLPVRFNYDDNYYNSTYQGIPEDGYTEVIRRILDHPLIEVNLETKYSHAITSEFSHTFFTGPIDEYFEFSEGRLGYRTVYWTKETKNGDFQGNAVINYTEESVLHTRIHEHKHFTPWEQHEKTIVFTEFSKETGEFDIPYYPKRMERDKELLAKYRKLALLEDNVSFLGRLATYRYMDMHHVIAEALAFSKDFMSARTLNLTPPTFPNVE
ncbi:MAG: UDP-galactopyranose mutase [Luteolibacter sp.]